jgi:hypothetical protein
MRVILELGCHFARVPVRPMISRNGVFRSTTTCLVSAPTCTTILESGSHSGAGGRQRPDREAGPYAGGTVSTAYLSGLQ